MCVAKEELDQLLSHEEIKKTKAPIVFFANKVCATIAASSVLQCCSPVLHISMLHNFNVLLQRDVAGSMGPEECTEELGLDRIRDKAWSIW